MEQTALIVQGWHIAMFIFAFALGGVLVTSLIMPYMRRLEDAYNEEFKEDYGEGYDYKDSSDKSQ